MQNAAINNQLMVFFPLQENPWPVTAPPHLRGDYVASLEASLDAPGSQRKLRHKVWKMAKLNPNLQSLGFTVDRSK